MKKYLVADDCIERFLCKSMNIRDQFGKHILYEIQVKDIPGE